MVQTLNQMLKFSDMNVKGHGVGHNVKSFGMNRQVSSQEMYMWNMTALPLMVQMLWYI